MCKFAHNPPYLGKGREKMKEPMKIDLNYIKRTFKEMNNEKGILGTQLINEVAFMKRTLKSLKDEIKNKGPVTKMSQGSYEIERANPAISQYNTMVKNYNTVIKQLIDILPKNDSQEDGFDDF